MGISRGKYLQHSAKGQTWRNHKYIAIKNGRYIYPGDEVDPKVKEGEPYDVPDMHYTEMRRKETIGTGGRDIYLNERKKRYKNMGRGGSSTAKDNIPKYPMAGRGGSSTAKDNTPVEKPYNVPDMHYTEMRRKETIGTGGRDIYLNERKKRYKNMGRGGSSTAKDNIPEKPGLISRIKNNADAKDKQTKNNTQKIVNNVANSIASNESVQKSVKQIRKATAAAKSGTTASKTTSKLVTNMVHPAAGTGGKDIYLNERKKRYKNMGKGGKDTYLTIANKNYEPQRAAAREKVAEYKKNSTNSAIMKTALKNMKTDMINKGRSYINKLFGR